MAVVYEKGQVVIPAYIRKMLGIHPGDEVTFSVEDNRIVVSKAESFMKKIRDLSASADLTFEETEKAIRKAEEKRRKGLDSYVH